MNDATHWNTMAEAKIAHLHQNTTGNRMTVSIFMIYYIILDVDLEAIKLQWVFF